ncbi:MAG: hypothetical protein ACQETH_16295 [Candidatus Rifleibacteriota bacterium]
MIQHKISEIIFKTIPGLVSSQGGGMLLHFAHNIETDATCLKQKMQL